MVGIAWDLDLDGCDVVVAAGGIGIAPLRSAILELIRFRERYGEVIVVEGARRPDLMLYEDQYDHWRERGIEVVTTIDVDEVGWSGHVGFVPAVVGGLTIDPEATSALVCGPDVMMRIAADDLVARGVPADRIQLTLERNMQCGNGLCGHCQLGGVLVCRDGPVLPYAGVAEWLAVEEL